MKTCQEIRQKLSAYQDGEVSQLKRDIIKAHLLNCDKCRRHLLDLEQTYQLIDILPEIKPDPNFTQRVMLGITDISLWDRFQERFLQSLPVPTAVAAMIIIGLFTGSLLGNLLIQNPSSRDLKQQITMASLTVFDAIPQGSIADGYFNMVAANMEHNYEK